MSKVALISGITGQDGSYLAELLLEKNYEVVGMVRRASTESNERIVHLNGKITLAQADLIDQSSINDVIKEYRPNEVYNLGAQSFVPTSWSQPTFTAEVTALGVTRMLEAIRQRRIDTKFYQASSSEMFGKVLESPQNETTPFYPRSPYGVAKVYGHYITVNYRESYGMFACCGILFNHESPRRGLEFVTRKITDHVARQACGLTDKPLYLGNMDAKRDWGHSKDYVNAMWMMLQQDMPDDYVIATGQHRTVREFVELSYECAGIELNWEGERGTTNERGVNKVRGTLVKIDPQFFRPAEVQTLLGDPTKARTNLKWKPEFTFEKLVDNMMRADMNRCARA